MGFLGLGAPKWRHKDARVRQAAVSRMGSGDEHLLVKVAMDDGEAALRHQAATKISGESHLRRLLESSDGTVIEIARSRLAGVAQKLVREGTLAGVRTLLEGIEEHTALAEIALTARDTAVRNAALDRLLSRPEPSQTALATIAIQDAVGAQATRVLPFIGKRSILKDITRKAKVEDVRRSAGERIATLDSQPVKPSAERQRKEREARLVPLGVRLGRVHVTNDITVAEAEFAACASDIDAVEREFAGLEDDGGLRAARARLERAREALSRLHADRAETERLAKEATTEVAKLAQAAAAAAVAAEPVYPVLSEADATELATLVTEAEGLIEQAEGRAWRDADYRFKVLHKRWMQLTEGGDPRLPDRMRFLRAWEAFKDRRRTFRAERDRQQAERIDLLRKLCTEAEALAAATPESQAHESRFQELKRLQAAWRAVGPVRDRDLGPIRERFQAATTKAFEPLAEQREAEDWERFANVAKAEALTAEVAALAEVQDLPVVARRVREAHKGWKEIGSLPRDRQQELWQAFKLACDTQYDRAKVHFAELDARREAAKVRKEELIAEATRQISGGSIGLAGSPADRAAKDGIAQRLKEIQAAWKEAGPAPRQDDDRLWTAFRAVCDGFFQGFNAQRDQELRVNLNRKEALCSEAEKTVEAAKALAGTASGERSRWLRQIKDLQAQWKDIGFIPRDRLKEVTDRFRSACDEIYQLGREVDRESPEELAANLTAKLDFCVRLEAIVEAGGPEAQEDAEQLRLRWKATGQAPDDSKSEVEARWKAAWNRLRGAEARR